MWKWMSRNTLVLIQRPWAGPAAPCWAVNFRWKPQKTGASSSHQGERSRRMSISYTNRRLSDWNPYWLTRPIDLVAPATNCRLRLLPSVCSSDGGFRVTRWPLHTKFKRVEMELLHLLRSQFLHSPGRPTVALLFYKLSPCLSHAFPPSLSSDSPRALSVHNAEEREKKWVCGCVSHRVTEACCESLKCLSLWPSPGKFSQIHGHSFFDTMY